MNIIVAGPRHWPNPLYVREVLEKLFWSANERLSGPITKVYVGDADGVDRAACSWAYRYCKKPVVFRAEWERLGRRAGVVRSAEMLAAAGAEAVLIAFVPAGGVLSVGTAHTVRMARRRGLRVLVASPDRPLWDSNGWNAPDRFQAMQNAQAEALGIIPALT